MKTFLTKNLVPLKFLLKFRHWIFCSAVAPC